MSQASQRQMYQASGQILAERGATIVMLIKGNIATTAKPQAQDTGGGGAVDIRYKYHVHDQSVTWPGNKTALVDVAAGTTQTGGAATAVHVFAVNCQDVAALGKRELNMLTTAYTVAIIDECGHQFG